MRVCVENYQNKHRLNCMRKEKKPIHDKEPEVKEEKKSEINPIKIDFDGLAHRTVLVPVSAGNISALAATKDYLLYATSDASFHL